MDPLLRSELIRYGEMAQSCYDAFDYDPFSYYFGGCRFPRRAFLDSLHLTRHGYDVTRYLYATANIRLPNFFTKSRWPNLWSPKANWIGYVAVSDDETSRVLGRRDIAIAWRGTVTRLEWLADLMNYLKPVDGKKIPSRDPRVKVQSGFNKKLHHSIRSRLRQVLTEVKRLTEKYDGAGEEVSITITGHSLGSALATLSAYDIAETGLNLVICVFSFSGPRVGNVRFKERLDFLGVKVLRVVNVHDIVPRCPGFLFNEDVPRVLTKLAEGLPWCYSHVGVELELDHKSSPFLKPTSDLVSAHNLEAHLHLLDGYHGKGQRFALASGRDPALVNKGSDFLQDHHMVPPFWRQDHNKGLIRTQDGRWMQPERPKLDDHPEDMHEYLTSLRAILS
ncbi:unnamed protein product [Linum tenue]|uniref:Fungal lipase-type domain-containing protein n=1 Tax=Linum tenue TaxID=586396 RepID=A0AAV0LL41_9ROSI|nr:unnamed protein product [Linum tenue]